MKALSPGTSRLAAIALTAVTLILLATYTVWPLWRYYTEKISEISQKQSQLQRFNLLLASEEAIDKQLDNIEQERSGADLFLKGSRPAIASANLREFIADAVQASGGVLVSSQEYDADAIDGATPIGLQIDVMADTENLVNLLHDVEKARPVVFVDKLMVSSSSSRVVPASSVRNGRRVRNATDPPQLRVRMSVLGYLLGSEVVEHDGDG